MIIPNRYNIRVYGICLNGADEVLIADERRGEILMTKFPGGGLEFGEGLVDGLKREFQEEAAADIEVYGLYYINDFLQISAFNPQDQLLSIYYTISLVAPLAAAISNFPFDFEPGDGDRMTFRWVAIENLDPAEFTFPIDKIVVEKLKKDRAFL